MRLVHPCASEGCIILTMGEFCIEHEQREKDSLADAVAAAVTYSAAEHTAPASA